MIFYRFAPISSQKGVLFFETPGIQSDISIFAVYGGLSPKYGTACVTANCLCIGISI